MHTILEQKNEIEVLHLPVIPEEIHDEDESQKIPLC